MTKFAKRRYTLVTFFYPGTFFSEESSQETKTKNPEEIAKSAPKRAFVFYLQDYVEKMAVVRGTKFEKTEPVGKPSPKYYLGGTVYTTAQLKKKFADDRSKDSLIGNCKSWGGKVILCRTGNWQPFLKGDVVLRVE